MGRAVRPRRERLSRNSTGPTRVLSLRPCRPAGPAPCPSFSGFLSRLPRAAARLALAALLLAGAAVSALASSTPEVRVESTTSSPTSHRIDEDLPGDYVFRVSAKSGGQLVNVTGDVKFRLRLIDDEEAEEGRDFEPFDKIITIPRGQSGVDVTLPIISDSDVEKYEHFTMRIEAPEGIVQPASVPTVNHRVRLYSNERAFAGFEKQYLDLVEGQSAELCIFFLIIDSSYQGNDFLYARDNRQYHLQEGRVDFPFQLSVSPLRGTADIDDDYVEPNREVTVPKGMRHGGKACKTVETKEDNVPEEQEQFELIVERLPGTNDYFVIQNEARDIYDEDRNLIGEERGPHFFVIINDKGHGFGTLNLEASARAGKIDASWNAIVTATRYELHHRQYPFGCEMGWTVDKYRDRIYDVIGRCPWTEVTLNGTTLSHTFSTSAKSGGVIEPTEVKVFAYGPDPDDTSREIVLAASEILNVEPSLTSQVSCSAYLRNTSVEPLFVRNPQGRPFQAVDQDNNPVYVPVAEDEELCIGPTRVIADQNAIYLGWGETQGAGIYGDNNGLPRAPYYRVEWKRADSVSENDWSNVESAEVNDACRIREGRNQDDYCYRIAGLDSGVEYHMRITALGQEEGLPSKTLKAAPQQGFNESRYRLVGYPVKRTLVEKHNLATPVCIHIERTDGQDFTLAQDIPLIITASSNAEKGTDYTIPSTATIPKAAKRICVPLSLSPTYDVVSKEKIGITISHGFDTLPPALGSIDAANTRVTVQDAGLQGQYRIRIDANDSVSESGIRIVVCLRLERSDGKEFVHPESVPLVMRTLDGTAGSPGDYTEFLDENINLTPTSRTQCRSIFMYKDTKAEPDETFFVTVRHRFEAELPELGSLDANIKRIIIRDDDGFRLVIEDNNGNDIDRKKVTEGLERDLCVRLERKDGDPFTISQDVPVILTATSTTATEGDDYVIKTKAGNSYQSATLPVTVNIDKDDLKVCTKFSTVNRGYEVERDETVNIAVRHGFVAVPSEFDDISPATAAIVIVDNDVVEAKLDKVIYEIEEGETANIAIVYRSANADTDCLIAFDTHIRIANTPHTVILKEDPDNPLPDDYPRDLNRDLPIERVDGYYLDKVVTMPACSTRVEVPWTSFENTVVERQTEQLFFAIHPMPTNPAGLRVNSRSRLDILDDDSLEFLFSNTVEEDIDGRATQVAYYEANEGDTIEIAYKLGDGAGFSFSLGVDADRDLVSFPAGSDPKKSSFQLTIPPYTTEGTFEVTLGEVDADTTVNLTLDGSLLRFQDSLNVPTNQRATITIKNGGGGGQLNSNLDGRNTPGASGGDLSGNVQGCPAQVLTKFYDDVGNIVNVSGLTMNDFAVENGTAEGLSVSEDGSRWTLNIRSRSGFTGFMRVTLAETGRWTVGEQVFRVRSATDCAPVARNALASLALDGLDLDPAFDAGTTAYTAAAPADRETVTVKAAAVYGASEVTVAPADADEDADGHQVALAEGETDIAVTVTPADGSAARTWTVTVTREAGAGVLTGFVLVDASNDADLGAVENGGTVSGSADGIYGVRAGIEENAEVGSVVLSLVGPGAEDTHTRTENIAPYSLYGDAPGGANGRAEHGRALAAGSYTLTATAYAARGGTGDVLGTLTVPFTVEVEAPPPPSAGVLTGFVLVDASTDADLGALTDGGTVPVSGGGSYGIRAGVEDNATVGSVVLTLAGPGAEDVHTQTENIAPYSLYGDAQGAEHGRALAVGSYTLTATAYAERGASGAVLGSLSVSFQVPGPAALSVADARVEEGPGATLDFAVTLDREAANTVTVAYATADGTATAGQDYTATSGTLTFQPGERAKTVSVPVLEDDHDEGSETLTLRLSNIQGATVADGEGTGTITNSDAIPEAWLARFGRTVTGQVLDAVQERLAASRQAGAQMSLAGQALPSWQAGDAAAADPGRDPGAGAGDKAAAAAAERAEAEARAGLASMTAWLAHMEPDPDSVSGTGPGFESRALTQRDFLTGTSFALTAKAGAGRGAGHVSLWGRGAIAGFDGREGALTVDGEVTTGLIGADWASDPGSGSGAGSGAGRWIAGLAIGHSTGTGGWRGANGSGGIEAVLTGLYPYAGMDLTDRLSVWAAAGWGAGEVTVTPDGEAGLTADLTMAMGAAGLRSELLRPEEGNGFALAVKGDARFTRTSSEAARSEDGNLAASEADVWLLRTGIEGSRPVALGESGATLTPSFEIGLRLDGGDAETGMGADLGGGLAFSDPKNGVALDLRARGLVAHQSPGFREWGASVSASWDPRPSTDRGLSLSLTQSWGASPAGGMDALLSRETLAGLAANDNAGKFEASSRLEGEIGYGLPAFGGAFTSTPNIGFGLSGGGAREWRLGWRLTSAIEGDPGFEVRLDATRREPANDDGPPEHEVTLRAAIRF